MVAVASTPAAVPTPSPEVLKAAASAGATQNTAFDAATLFVADKASREAAAHALASAAKNDSGLFTKIDLTSALVKALTDKKNAHARDGAVETIAILVAGESIKQLEPVVIEPQVLTALLETFADKSKATATAAVDATVAFVSAMSPWATTLILPSLLHQIKTAGKWQVKTGSLQVLNQLVISAPTQTAKATPDIIPALSEAIWDTKADVKKAARESLTKVTALISNKDIERCVLVFLPNVKLGADLPSQIHPCPYFRFDQPREGGPYYHSAPLGYYFRFRGRLPDSVAHGPASLSWSQREAHRNQAQGRRHHRQHVQARRLGGHRPALRPQAPPRSHQDRGHHR